MSRERTPTREAKGIAAALLRSYLTAGQPMEDCGCDGCPRCNAVVRAIEKLEERLDVGAGLEPTPEPVSKPTFIPGDPATGRRWEWVPEDGDR